MKIDFRWIYFCLNIIVKILSNTNVRVIRIKALFGLKSVRIRRRASIKSKLLTLIFAFHYLKVWSKRDFFTFDLLKSKNLWLLIPVILLCFVCHLPFLEFARFRDPLSNSNYQESIFGPQCVIYCSLLNINMFIIGNSNDYLNSCT